MACVPPSKELIHPYHVMLNTGEEKNYAMQNCPQTVAPSVAVCMYNNVVTELFVNNSPNR